MSRFWQAQGLPVRMAVPVGPRPRSVSAQVTFKCFEIAFLEAGMGDGPDGPGLVLLGEADPDHRMAAVSYNDPAYFIEVIGFGRRRAAWPAAVLERLQSAVEGLKLRLAPLALRDVPHGGMAQATAGGVAGTAMGLDRDARAVAAQQLVLGHALAPGADVLHHALAILGRDVLLDGAADNLLHRPAEHLRELFIAVHDAALLRSG